MIKKLIVILFVMAFFTVVVNLTYDFFMIGDNIGVYDNVFFRKTYANREILEGQVNAESLEHNDMRIWVKSSSYDKETGRLEILFEFEDVNKVEMNDLCMKLRVHDDSYVFYNKVVGNKLFADEIDYFVRNIYAKAVFDITMVLNLGKGYEIDNYLYVEFLDMLYNKDYDRRVNKVFDKLGEFKFKFKF